MNVQQHIARLESLLSRIRNNAGKGRVAAAAPVPEPSNDEPPIAEPPEAVAYEAAQAVAAAPAPSPEPEELSAKPTVPPVAAADQDEIPVEETAPEVEELDMSDAEIVEISVEVTESEPPPPLANELAEEPAPESAPRPAAQAEEAELEPPVKTPPPESGRQVVAAPGISGELELEAPAAPSDLEADMSGGPISKAPPGEPTAAQLGETVELDGADSPPARIELLSAPMSAPVAPPAIDDLELSLPQRGFGGGYDAELAPPSRAAEDLARHRDQEAAADEASLKGSASHDEPAAAPTSSLGMAPPEGLVSPPSVETVHAEPAAAAGPLIVERPALGDRQVAQMRAPAPPAIPATFLELLDASLAIDV